MVLVCRGREVPGIRLIITKYIPQSSDPFLTAPHTRGYLLAVRRNNPLRVTLLVMPM